MRTLRSLTKATSLRASVGGGMNLGTSGAGEGGPAAHAAHAAHAADVFLQLCRRVDRRRLDFATVLDGLERWCPPWPPDEAPAAPGPPFEWSVAQGQDAGQCEYWTAVHLEFARRLAVAEGEFHDGAQAGRLLAIAIDRSLNAVHSLHGLACDAHARNWHAQGSLQASL